MPLAQLGIRHPHRPKLVRPRPQLGQDLQSEVEPGATLVQGPYVAETFAVSVEQDYVVIDA